jgi:VanZ family protein
MILRYNILPILWAVLILILSLISGENIPEVSFWEMISIDKLAHVFMYAMLVFLLTTGLKRQYSNGWLRYYAKSTAFWLGMFYGLLLEIMQLLICTDRYFEMGDVIANSIGCLIGLFGFILVFGKELSR